MGQFKQIRTLKRGGARRPSNTNTNIHSSSSVEDPLVRAEDGRRSGSFGDDAENAAAVAVANVDGGLASTPEGEESPASAPSGGPPRSGASLWGLARNRTSDVRALAAVPENQPLAQSLSQQISEQISNGDRTQSIVEKFMFTLSSSPSFISYRSDSSVDTNGEPRRKQRRKVPGVWSPRSDAHYLWHMIMGSVLNVLLLAIPLGVGGGFMGYSPSLVFWSNFMALLPLALILGEITEDLAVRFGDTIGGLLNASFGNVVEMILGLAALSKGLYKVVAASLIGSILSNLLLVLGCCFLFGGFRHKHQRFNTLANKVSSSLLFLSCISIMIPTTAKSVYGDQVMSRDALVSLSHAIAIMLVGMYICYLFFQLKTHADSLHGSPSMFLLPKGISIPPDVSETDFIGYLAAAVAAQNTGSDDGSGGAAQQEQQSSLVTNITTSNSNGNLIPNGGGNEVEEVQVDDVTTGGQIKEEEEQEHEEEEGGDDDEGQEHVPRLSLSCAIFSLSIITILVAICSEFLTGAIEAVSASSGINEAFLGLIVLPIAGNAAEHITAVFVAVKNKMDLAISVALGSSIQIAIFVLPVTVLAGWAMGKELTLDFDPFAVLMMTVSVILAYFVSSDGFSNWLLGLQLVVTYVLIGLVYLLEKEQKGSDQPSPLSVVAAEVQNYTQNDVGYLSAA